MYQLFNNSTTPYIYPYSFLHIFLQLFTTSYISLQLIYSFYSSLQLLTASYISLQLTTVFYCEIEQTLKYFQMHTCFSGFLHSAHRCSVREWDKVGLGLKSAILFFLVFFVHAHYTTSFLSQKNIYLLSEEAEPKS